MPKRDDPEITTEEKTAEESETEEKAKSPAEMKRELFEAVSKAMEAEEKAKKAWEKAKATRSAAIKKIKDTVGSGRYRWKGKVVRISRRGDNYHFVEESEPDIEEIG